MSTLEEKIALVEKDITETKEEIKKVPVGSETWKILMNYLIELQNYLKELQNYLKELQKEKNILLEQAKGPQGKNLSIVY